MKTTSNRIFITIAITALLFIARSNVQAQLGKQMDLLNPNTAAEADLAKVPHLNANLAKGLIAKRPFLSMTQLNTHLKQSLSDEQLKDVYGKLFLPVDLNNASREDIMLIPGAGRKMAHEFDEYRPYKSFVKFRKEIAKYVDEKEVARFEQYLFIAIDLNTASDENIKSIPGLGNRMLHEFKEYRPYKTMAQFRKEIGKYVDEKEVARLERYVTIGK